jgi:molybdopterin-containing oxidoreductase family iron-sulfur binding subunit
MPLDLDALRQRLADREGPLYWRSLEELADTPEFRELMEREFPEQASEWSDPVTRRQFLTLMGASLALAGLAGCSPRPAPHEKIMPYVRQPEELVPGRPLFYATAMSLGASVTGLLVKSHEGRPTKVEGNPNHPSSRGATDVFAQGAVLTLYDPDRSKTITYRGRPRGWDEALDALRGALEKQRGRRGASLRLLTETVTSPTLAALLGQVLKEFPEAKWYQYEPVNRDNVHAGARLAFGPDTNVTPRYNVKDADVILSLDADFLYWGPGHLSYARDFIDRRRVRTRGPDGKPVDQATMNRLYVVECMPSITGAKADNRLPLPPREIEPFARALAAKLGVAGVQGTVQGPAAKWVDALADDLRFLGKDEPRKPRPPGTTLVLAGDGQPPAVQALAHAMNQALGNFGKTVVFTRPVEARTESQFDDLGRLVGELRNGQVEMLAILGGNPVFTAPVNRNFAGALETAITRRNEAGQEFLSFHLGLYQDETAVQCDWHIPEAHFLEAWGDTRAHDGTAALVQPLIAPLYGGRSAYEFLDAFTFTQSSERTGHEIVRGFWYGYWRENKGQGPFEHFWQAALRDGVVPRLDKEFEPQSVSLHADWAKAPEGAGAGPPAAKGSYDIVFQPDPCVHDGRFANNGWLQELPKPITRLTWDNAALVGVKTAEELGLLPYPGQTGGEHGRAWAEEVRLTTYFNAQVTMPAFVVPGHPENVITVHLGYGRPLAGRTGTGAGTNVYPLRRSDHPWFDSGVSIERTGRRVRLACVQMHHMLSASGRRNGPVLSREQRQTEERQPVHAATLEEFKRNPDFANFLEVAREFEPEVRALVPGPNDTPEGDRESDKEGDKNARPEAPDRRLVPLSLYPQDQQERKGYAGYRWAMAIDLTACVGCNACVIACQAENNIPVVGKTEVTRGREMHWLRVDTYYYGSDFDNPTTFFQPVPCMHCEKAPCELVCPVEATAHSHDGLNDMIYNRCVGTRYCSNNCPYKVRRFNFFQYADYATASLKLLHNPEVTVRSRGVMEKCTYCVQRIRAADIEAQKRLVREAQARGTTPEDPDVDRKYRVQDGEVLTACQQACPARAIVFGDLNGPGRGRDESSEVYRWKDEPLNYALLGGLNTQPRTTYLAALRNPNPELM